MNVNMLVAEIKCLIGNRTDLKSNMLSDRKPMQGFQKW